MSGAATDVSEKEDKTKIEESGTTGAEDKGHMTNTLSSEGGAEAASSYCVSLDLRTSNEPDGVLSSCFR
jgi:hypothetical protein